MTEPTHHVDTGLPRTGDSEGVAAATSLLGEISAADGVEPFGEAFVRGLGDAAAGHRHLTVYEGSRPVGLAAIAEDAVELAVAADARRRGAGSALLGEVDRAVGKQLPVWAHGDVDGAAELAAGHGRRPVRELLQMTAGPGALERLRDDEPAPTGIHLETLGAARARLGAEAVDAAWLAVNNEAFDWHPEQGGWDLAQLLRARDVEWFEPEGVLFAIDEDTGAVVGFHWTKWHGDGVGEVYVIGLAGAARGRGVGGWLTRAGMAHLRRRGAQRVILYVEGDNAPAVRTYERTGFEVSRRDVMYGV